MRHHFLSLILLIALTLMASSLYAQSETLENVDLSKSTDINDKSWAVFANFDINLGTGAFVKEEFNRRVRSRYVLDFGASYTIPYIDTDLSFSTGFSQWISKTGKIGDGFGNTSKYEFRWGDSRLSLSRPIWRVKGKEAGFSIDASLNFNIPTSKASRNEKLYTTVTPYLVLRANLAQFNFAYAISYSANFHKYTSLTFNPSEVDILSRSSGIENISSTEIASLDGVLTQHILINTLLFSYQFIKQLSLKIRFSFVDAWTYDNKTITKKDEFTDKNAKVGRGHAQVSDGYIALAYSPFDFLGFDFYLKSTQPWKYRDNKDYRFPFIDFVSPANNFTTIGITTKFNY